MAVRLIGYAGSLHASGVRPALRPRSTAIAARARNSAGTYRPLRAALAARRAQ